MAIIDKVFKAAIDNNASDVHIAPGEPFRNRGQIFILETGHGTGLSN
jgi:type II secretory ATPase GspE/PulE/Tfp pilus assembly ATPase PilB-like protein